MPASKKHKPLIVRLRRDLRIADNASLHHACRPAQRLDCADYPFLSTDRAAQRTRALALQETAAQVKEAL